MRILVDEMPEHPTDCLYCGDEHEKEYECRFFYKHHKCDLCAHSCLFFTDLKNDLKYGVNSNLIREKAFEDY